MLEFGTGVTARRDVADLLELERTFEGDRIVVLTAHEEHDLCAGVAAGDRRDLLLKFDNTGDQGGEFLQFGDDPTACGTREVADSPQEKGDQGEHGDLGREGLRCRHADLRTGVHVDTPVALPGDGACNIVANAEGAVTLALALPKGGERIGRLSTLTQDKDQSVLGHRKVAVTELTRKLALRGDLRECFNDVFPDHRGMEGGAAPAQNNTLDGPQVGVRHVEPAEFRGGLLVSQPAAQGIGHAADLLVDLLEHVVGIVPLADILFGHFDCGDVVVGAVPLHRGKGKALPGQCGNLVVVEVNHITRVTDDGAHVAGKKVLSLADPQDERTAPASPDDEARQLGMDDGDPVGARDLTQRLAHRRHKGSLGALRCPVKGTADEMCQHLGVGLRLKLMALLLQLGAQRGVVLDDTVVNEGEFSRTVGVRMGVLTGDLAVGGPARVTDTRGAADGCLGDG